MIGNWKIFLTLFLFALAKLNVGVQCEEAHLKNANVVVELTKREENEETDALDCLLLDKGLFGCLRGRLARAVDQIELNTLGKSNGPPISTAIEKTGEFIAQLVHDFQHPRSSQETLPHDQSRSSSETPRALAPVEEARRKKFGKKKKKHLQKLLGVAMLLKAKLSLLLQLISTHFQLKFFVLAIVNLILNAAKFWLDLKKSHPSKVIYYEHAQHQHHYDHDDHDHSGYWGRSSNGFLEDLPYSAYKPNN